MRKEHANQHSQTLPQGHPRLEIRAAWESMKEQTELSIPGVFLGQEKRFTERIEQRLLEGSVHLKHAALFCAFKQNINEMQSCSHSQ